MSIQYGGDKITFPDGSTVGSGWSGFKNRIINGAMVIDQRGSASTPVTGSGFSTDRWQAYKDTASGTWSIGQSSVAPTGFIKSLGVTIGTAFTPSSGEGNTVLQRIEGLNAFDLSFGTASAKSVTVSFWVRSSVTGTMGGSLRNSGGGRSYPFTYTINVADTWEQKFVTIAGDTSGTWPTGTTEWGAVWFSIGTGSALSGTSGSWVSANAISATGATSITSTAGATWYITGVQLEKGTAATSFDYRPYGTELALCQRYFFASATNNGYQIGVIAQSTVAEYTIKLPVTMRTAPSFSALGFTGYGGASGNYNVYVYNTSNNAPAPVTPSLTVNLTNTDTANVLAAISGGTLGNVCNFDLRTGLKLAFNAEL